MAAIEMGIGRRDDSVITLRAMETADFSNER
jgi:hypothetical protein